MIKLPNDFYLQDDVIALSQNLIGKFLFTNIDGALTGGMIVETEAYRGPDDRASHASGNKRTARNEVMYHKGGIAYVYVCYGIHNLFNVVTNVAGIPHAILIRAIEPTHGEDVMLVRRNKQKIDNSLTGGPGAMSQALGITKEHNGLSLSGSSVWIEERNVVVKSSDIIASPRVGVAYAGEDAALPWRFRYKDSPWTSKYRT